MKKDAGYTVLARTMKEDACKSESRNKTIVARNDLKHIQKRENQPAIDYCVGLERLTI